MNHKNTNVYSKCVELSKKSTPDSLNELIKLYLSSNKEIQKTARTALKKTRNKQIVFSLINEKLAGDIGAEDKLLLLKLGYSMSRYDYLDLYIDELKRQGTDLKIAGFFRGIRDNPLSLSEKKKLAEYIIKYKDFDAVLFGHAYSEETKDELYNALLDSITEEGITDEKLNIIKDHSDYLDLLQNELLKELLNDPEGKKNCASYLDFSIEENMNFLIELSDLVEIYGVLRKNYFIDEILYSENFYVSSALSIIKEEQIEDDEWIKIKQEIEKHIDSVENVEDDIELLQLIVGTKYIDSKYAEDKLISLYKQSRLYTNVVFGYLMELKSPYAYREMLSFMLTSEDRIERQKYAIQLVINYPENAASVYLYAKELNDDGLMKALDAVTTKFNIDVSFAEKYNDVILDSKERIQVLPRETIISELLFDLAKEINANKFYSAVGFTFQSGLRMLYPLIDYIYDNGGEIELISGSLQGFESGSKTTKIDKETVRFLNFLHVNKNLSLFTYTDNFYHGKYYYLASDDKAYVIIGSTNISKTAFLNNYELDTIINLDNNSGQNQFISWYESFRSQCVSINHLDENNYDDFKWESELDIYSTKVVRRVSNYEIGKKIQELSDEETKFRLNTWMQHEPSEIYSDLGIASLPEYIVFLYPNIGLAVFESFTPGNAYYTFRYYDFDILLDNVAKLTKTQMLTTSSFLNRGYHINDRSRLTQKIDALFGY